jgi:hypothetical protein
MMRKLADHILIDFLSNIVHIIQPARESFKNEDSLVEQVRAGQLACRVHFLPADGTVITVFAQLFRRCHGVAANGKAIR